MTALVLGWQPERPNTSAGKGSNGKGANMASLPARRTERVSPQTVQRWEPFNELEQLQEQMERLMHSVWSPSGSGNGGVWIPVADIEETEDAWVIEAELPGVDRKDINVEL